MDIAKTVYDVLKDIGPAVCKYGKYQLKFSEFVRGFGEMKEKLQVRRDDIESEMRSQLRFGLMAKGEVTIWLRDVDQKMTAADIDDLINNGGCFCHICRAKKLDDKTAELGRLFGDGATFTQANQRLVKDDPSIIVDSVRRVEEVKKGLKRRKDDVESALQSQLHYGMIEKLEVRGWLDNAKDVLIKVEAQVNSSSTALILEEKFRELNEVCEQGTTYTLPNQILVRVDPSIIVDFEEAKKRLQRRKDDVESALQSQLHYGKIDKLEVRCWLDNAKDAITEVEARVNSSSTALILEEKVRELNEVCEQGATFNLPNQILVMDDPSIIVDFVSRAEEAKERLQRRKDDVESALQSQLHYGKTEKLEVRGWLDNAKDAITEVEAQVNNSSTALFLEEKIRELNELCEQGATFTLPNQILVNDDPSIKGVALSSIELHGRNSVLEKIINFLTRDDVGSVAVWGMGGVGKTTIMKKVNDHFLGESKFKKVIWVTVSKEFNVLNIQNEIAEQLKEQAFSEGRDATWRAGAVSKMLLRGDYLLIFDDVWEEFPFEEAGIPIGGSRDSHFKFAMTTRFREVAEAIDCEIIPLKPLSKDESLKLFLGNIGSAVVSDDGKIKEDVEATLKLVVEECDGLPLALVTVAKSMKAKSSLNLWQNAFNELKKGNKKVFNTLKFSYDSLEDASEQSCFLYAALYPEDAEIPKLVLIENWIEEGYLAEKETRYAMICKGHAILQKLEDRCLFECIKYANREVEHVRMHDLLRAMALDIMGSQVLVKSGVGLTELPNEAVWKKDLQKVSLMRNRIRKIRSTMPSPKCSMLTTLRLWNNLFETIPESFFEDMPGLKILDLSYNVRLVALPNSVSKLVNLTTLLLGWCKRLKKLPSLSKLKVLTKLDLNYTAIRNLPEGLEMLWNLKYLDLGRLFYLSDVEVEGERFVNEILPKFPELEYLVVDPQIQLKAGDIVKLVNLERFSGRFPAMKEWSNFVRSRSVCLNEYDVFLAEGGRSVFPRGFNRIISCYELDTCREQAFLLPNVKELEIEDCEDVRSLNDMPGFQDATDLRDLSITNCESLETLSRLSCLRLNPLQHLQYLYLSDLSNLIRLFEEGELPPGTFSSLKYLHIELCRKMSKLILSRLLNLQNLLEIDVSDCDSVEEIIGSKPEQEDEREVISKLFLPKLRTLKLKSMVKLRSICSPNTVLVCESIKKLKIRSCPNLICENVQGVFGPGFNPFHSLECLNIEDVKNLRSVFDEGALPFSPNINCFPLTQLYISDCDNLNKLFTPSLLLENLQNLELIDVENCQKLEEIISFSSEEEEKSLQLALPKLCSLSLNNLPSLNSICSSSCVLICNSLSRLKITQCTKLKRIPLYLPLLDNSQPSLPSSLKEIKICASIWESLEWDHPNAKEVLRPLCYLRDYDKEEEMDIEEETESGEDED